jgi:hypothetical protein
MSYLGDYGGLAPKAAGFGNYGFGAFGAFGKGYYAPPPSTPKPIQADYRGGTWSCDNQPRPAEDVAGYYHCCPSGWTKVPFGDTRPCKGNERSLSVCGPLPEGATHAEAVCCENMKEWVPAGEGGGDPCKAAAIASGKAVPGMMETMLAPEIIERADTLVTPTMMIVGGLAAAGVIGLTVFMKMM